MSESDDNNREQRAPEDDCQLYAALRELLPRLLSHDFHFDVQQTIDSTLTDVFSFEYGHDYPSLRRAIHAAGGVVQSRRRCRRGCRAACAARAEAAEIVAAAESQAADIRRQAAEAGCKAAMQEFEKTVAVQLAPAIEAFGQAVAELRHEKQAWISHWETGAVRLAAAIAARIIRREVRQQPEITLALVREALDLAAGSPNVRLHLSPEDYKSLGSQVRALIDAISALGDAEVTPTRRSAKAAAASKPVSERSISRSKPSCSEWKKNWRRSRFGEALRNRKRFPRP